MLKPGFSMRVGDNLVEKECTLTIRQIFSPDILCSASVLTSYIGRIQCEVLTTLPFCFTWIKKFDNNRKSEMTALWRNYSGKLQEIFIIIGPKT